MLRWLREKLLRHQPRSTWSVAVKDGAITTRDGHGSVRSLAIADLRKVIVATDDSGPWGDDVVFLLFADLPEPVSIFPLEAAGCQDFVEWLSGKAGYDDREMAKAMGSTSVAEFVVFKAPS